MPQFAPGEARIAIAPIRVVPSGLSCQAEIFLGPDEMTKMATSDSIPFTSIGVSQDVRLPVTMPDAGGTYHVFIDIYAEGLLIAAYEATEDVVIRGVPTTEILRPNAPGDETSIEVVSPPTWAHWEAVSDASDGYRVYNWGCILRCPYCGNVYGDYATLLYHIHLEHPGLPDPPERTVYKRDLYNLPTPTGFGTINYIKVYMRGRGTSMADEGIRASIKSNGIVTDGDEIDPTAFWAWYSHQWNTNPANGQPWEWSDINNLQIGVSLRAQAVAKELRPGGYYCECSQVYVEVGYTP